MEVVGSGIQERLRTSDRDAHVSASEHEASVETSFLFNNARVGATAQYNNCSVCVIKPHAVLGGVAGQIIERILQVLFPPCPRML